MTQADADVPLVSELPLGPHTAEALCVLAGSLGMHAVRIDLEGCTDEDDLFGRIAQALEFPDWFGRNWDALADCLGDLSWKPADGYLILLEHCDGFRAGHGGDFTTALQVFAAASEAWRGERVPFWVLVDTHADGIACLPGLD